MVKLIISPEALDDLNEICDFIALDSDDRARNFITKIVDLIEDIPKFPRIGRMVPEYNNEEIREKIFNEYRVVYKLGKDKIEIVHIAHGSKLLSNLEP